MVLNIVTPTTRPENLEKLFTSIVEQWNFLHDKNSFKIKWWIIIDASLDSKYYSYADFMDIKIIKSNISALAGHAHRNDVLDQLVIGDQEEWFYSLDDDNIIHPGFFEALYNCIEDGLIVAQSLKDDSLRLPVDSRLIKLNHIDTAMFAFKVKLVGDLRFFEDRYDADGVFIEELYRENKDKFELINKPLSYYNYLR